MVKKPNLHVDEIAVCKGRGKDILENIVTALKLYLMQQYLCAKRERMRLTLGKVLSLGGMCDGERPEMFQVMMQEFEVGK